MSQTGFSTKLNSSDREEIAEQKVDKMLIKFDYGKVVRTWNIKQKKSKNGSTATDNILRCFKAERVKFDKIKLFVRARKIETGVPEVNFTQNVIF